MSGARKRKKVVPPAKFDVGDKVRVKHGVRDADYPDVPIGGWAGVITEVDGGGVYTIRWSRQTLAAIHPVFKTRCEKDGLDIEQPEKLKTVPLDPEDQDDRLRMVFGLTSNDPLPDVGIDTLLTYYRYLSKHMRFPFEVDHFEETGPFDGKWRRVTVLALLDPEEYSCDRADGLISIGRVGRLAIEFRLSDLEVDRDDPGLQTLADYCYWFWNHG